MDGGAKAAPPVGAEVAPPTDLQTESLSDISDDDADEILNRDYEVRPDVVFSRKYELTAAGMLIMFVVVRCLLYPLNYT